jgi:hypothetical protein
MALSPTNKIMLTRSTSPTIIHTANLMSSPFQRRFIAHYIFPFQLGGLSFWFSTYNFTLPLPSIIPSNATWYQLLQPIHHGAHTLVPLPHLLYLRQLCHHLQDSTIEQVLNFQLHPNKNPICTFNMNSIRWMRQMYAHGSSSPYTYTSACEKHHF